MSSPRKPIRIADRRRRRLAFDSLDGRLLLSGPGTIPVGGATAVAVGASSTPWTGQVRFSASIDDYARNIRVVIDWGDGTHSEGMVAGVQSTSGATGDPYAVSGTHRYLTGGNYRIAATVIDEDGSIGQGATSVNLANPLLNDDEPAVGPLRSGPVLALFQTSNPFFGRSLDPDTSEVEELYSTILGRPADAAGRDADVAALEAGASPAMIASNLLHSAEYETDLVSSYYQTYLGRNASLTEISGWVSLMQNGMTAEQVATDFLTSAEFNSAHPGDNSFALALCEDVLDRAPTTADLSAWMTVLGSGVSRASAVADFLNSPEAGATAAKDFYADFLGRPIDTLGRQADVAALQAGASQVDLLTAIVGSPEFAGPVKVTTVGS